MVVCTTTYLLCEQCVWAVFPSLSEQEKVSNEDQIKKKAALNEKMPSISSRGKKTQISLTQTLKR